MPPTATRCLSLLGHLSRVPADLLVRLSDDADQVWEPFLRDDVELMTPVALIGPAPDRVPAATLLAAAG